LESTFFSYSSFLTTNELKVSDVAFFGLFLEDYLLVSKFMFSSYFTILSLKVESNSLFSLKK